MRHEANNGEVDIWFGGQVRTLVLKSKALRFIEETTGRSFMALFRNSGEEGLGLGFLNTALVAGLRYYDPKVTADQVDNWLDEMGSKAMADGYDETLASLFQKVSAALVSGMPGTRATAAEDPTKAMITTTAN
jgi:hypothetical protein